MFETASTGAQPPWVEVHALAAEHGDCIVLSYGGQGEEYRLVVDAGVAKTSDRLRRLLDVSGNAVWELLVVTHIDLDHIGGTLSLLADKSVTTRFADVWFNGRQHLELGREGLAFAEGEQLARTLKQEGISWNRMFQQQAVCLTADGCPVQQTLPASGATITLLSPARAALGRLRGLWDAWLKREADKAKQEAPSKGAIAPTPPPGVEVLSAGPLTISDLAKQKSATDSSVANASSIAFIFEYKGFRLLLGADAHAEVLMQSATKLPQDKLGLDLFKLPHHGSAANLTINLAQKIPARRYLMTTDGIRHSTHPSDIAIARALCASPNAELVFNYPNEASMRWAMRPPEPGYAFSVLTGDPQEGVRVMLK